MLLKWKIPILKQYRYLYEGQCKAESTVFQSTVRVYQINSWVLSPDQNTWNNLMHELSYIHNNQKQRRWSGVFVNLWQHYELY